MRLTQLQVSPPPPSLPRYSTGTTLSNGPGRGIQNAANLFQQPILAGPAGGHNDVQLPGDGPGVLPQPLPFRCTQVIGVSTGKCSLALGPRDGFGGTCVEPNNRCPGAFSFFPPMFYTALLRCSQQQVSWISGGQGISIRARHTRRSCHPLRCPLTLNGVSPGQKGPEHRPIRAPVGAPLGLVLTVSGVHTVQHRGGRGRCYRWVKRGTNRRQTKVSHKGRLVPQAGGSSGGWSRTPDTGVSNAWKA